MAHALSVDDGSHAVLACALEVRLNGDGTDGHLTPMCLFTIPALCVLPAVQLPAVHDTNLMLCVQCTRQVIVTSLHPLLFREHLFWPLDMKNLRFCLRLQSDVHQIPAVEHIHCYLSCEVSRNDLVDDVQTRIHRHTILTIDLVICQLGIFLIRQMIADVLGDL